MSNYAGPVCEGHVFLSGFGRANNILGGTCCFPTVQNSHWMVRRGTPLYTVNDNISTNSGLTETRDREQCFQFVQANLSPAPSLQRKGESRLRVVAVTILDMTNKK